MSGTVILLFPGLPFRHSPTQGTWTDKPVPQLQLDLQLTQGMTTPVSVQLEKGGFPKRFWAQSQESVFAPVPCGVPFEPRPESSATPGATGSGWRTGPKGAGVPLAGGFGRLGGRFCQGMSGLLPAGRSACPPVRSWGSGTSTQIPFCLETETKVILMEWWEAALGKPHGRLGICFRK